MPNIVGEISTTSAIWWFFSVCVMSVVLNLVADYAKPWLDRTGSRLFTTYKDRTVAAKSRRAAEIERLRHSETQRIHQAIEINRVFLYAAMYLMVCAIFLIFGMAVFVVRMQGSGVTGIGGLILRWGSIGTSCLAILEAARHGFRANYLRDLLKEASLPESTVQHGSAIGEKG